MVRYIAEDGHSLHVDTEQQIARLLLKFLPGKCNRLYEDNCIENGSLHVAIVLLECFASIKHNDNNFAKIKLQKLKLVLVRHTILGQNAIVRIKFSADLAH